MKIIFQISERQFWKHKQDVRTHSIIFFFFALIVTGEPKEWYPYQNSVNRKSTLGIKYIQCTLINLKLIFSYETHGVTIAVTVVTNYTDIILRLFSQKEGCAMVTRTASRVALSVFQLLYQVKSKDQCLFPSIPLPLSVRVLKATRAAI